MQKRNYMFILTFNKNKFDEFFDFLNKVDIYIKVLTYILLRICLNISLRNHVF